MSYTRIEKIYPPVPSTGVDLGSNVAVVWEPAENMIVHGWGLNVTEATHTATVTTSAVVTFAYDAANAGTTVTKGTVSVGVGKTVGEELSHLTTPPFKVTGGTDSLEWTLTTDISATTTTGVSVPFVYAEIFPAIAPA